MKTYIIRAKLSYYVEILAESAIQAKSKFSTDKAWVQSRTLTAKLKYK